jgi:hypothetical protein
MNTSHKLGVTDGEMSKGIVGSINSLTITILLIVWYLYLHVCLADIINRGLSNSLPDDSCVSQISLSLTLGF